MAHTDGPVTLRHARSTADMALVSFAPEVTSTRKEIAEAIEGAFRRVRMDAEKGTGKVSFNMAAACLEALRGMNPEQAEEVSVSYFGSRIGFSYEGPLPPAMLANYMIAVLPRLGIYEATNEHYGQRMADMLGTVTGITNYLGILGGVDGAISQLGVLERHNSITSVQFVDGNTAQIVYGMLKIYEYDTSEMRFITGGGMFPTVTDTGIYTESGFKVRMVAADIGNALAEVRDPGVYFVYLSNVFDAAIFTKSMTAGRRAEDRTYGWNDIYETRDILHVVLQNPNIRDGSYVMINAGGQQTALILRKEDGRIVVRGGIGKLPGEEIATKRQQHWIDSLLC